MRGSARGVVFVVFLNTLLISLMDFGNWQLENNNKILLKPGTESTNLWLLFMQTIFRPMISLKNISDIGAAVLYSRWIPTAALVPGKTSSNGINVSSSPQNKFQHLVTSDTRNSTRWKRKVFHCVIVARKPTPLAGAFQGKRSNAIR